VETDGTVGDGAWVIELTDLIELDSWPDGTRVIARRERSHPGAQLTLFDVDNGYRHQLFITDQTDRDIAALELRHRHRAHVENRIRAAKDTGLRNLPCVDVLCNDTWLQLVLIAQDLMAWSQRICFDGALAVAEPKRLRHRVFHAAATIAHTGRQTIVRFQQTWPWTTDITLAFRRLRIALPCPAESTAIRTPPSRRGSHRDPVGTPAHRQGLHQHPDRPADPGPPPRQPDTRRWRARPGLTETSGLVTAGSTCRSTSKARLPHRDRGDRGGAARPCTTPPLGPYRAQPSGDAQRLHYAPKAARRHGGGRRAAAPDRSQRALRAVRLDARGADGRRGPHGRPSRQSRSSSASAWMRWRTAATSGSWTSR